jgi:hypothetical protein
MEGHIGSFITSGRKSVRQQLQPKNNHKKKKATRNSRWGHHPSWDTHLICTIFDMLDKGRMLRVPEILNVTSLLELFLDVLGWSAQPGLLKVMSANSTKNLFT